MFIKPQIFLFLILLFRVVYSLSYDDDCRNYNPGALLDQFEDSANDILRSNTLNTQQDYHFQIANIYKMIATSSFIKKCGQHYSKKDLDLMLKSLLAYELIYPTIEREKVLKMLVKNHTFEGDAFVEAYTIIRNSPDDDDIFLKTISNRSKEEAELLAMSKVRSIAAVSKNQNRIELDKSELYCQLVDLYISKPEEKLSRLHRIITFDDFQVNDNCATFLYLETLRSIQSNGPQMDICDLKNIVGDVLVIVKNNKVRLGQIGIFEKNALNFIGPLLKFISHEEKKYKEKDDVRNSHFSCHDFTEKRYMYDTEELASWLSEARFFSDFKNQSPNQSNINVCNPVDIKNWILSEINTGYKVESFKIEKSGKAKLIKSERRRIFTGGQFKNCHFMSRIEPMTKKIKDPLSKKMVDQRWAKVRLEVFTPRVELLQFEVLDDEIVLGIYDQFERSGLIKTISPQTNTAPRMTPLPAAIRQ